MLELRSMRKVSPILKPVSARCNLACHYCYYKHTHGTRTHGVLMPDDTLTKIIVELIGIARSMGTKAEFTWHGGEPTLAGLSFYQKVVRLQTDVAARYDGEIEIDNNIQTNGTLLNNQWAEFLKENNFSIGLSLDGPKWVHDARRLYASGRGSFARVMRTVGLLQRFGIRFGVIGVVTEISIGHGSEILDFFLDHGIKQLDLVPCAELPGDRGVASYTIQPEKYADFIIELFEQWLARNDPEIHIRFLENAVQGFFGAEPGLCSMSRDYCGVFPTILPNGDVYFCDNYEGSEDMLIGNIAQVALSDLLAPDRSRHSEIRSQIFAAKEQCRQECEWYSMCGGGCPRYNRSNVGQLFQPDNYFCRAYKRILAHVSVRTKAVMESVISQGAELRDETNNAVGQT